MPNRITLLQGEITSQVVHFVCYKPGTYETCVRAFREQDLPE